jgi:hypothetical protein
MRVIRVGGYKIHAAYPSVYYVVQSVISAAAYPNDFDYFVIRTPRHIELKNIRHCFSS